MNQRTQSKLPRFVQSGRAHEGGVIQGMPFRGEIRQLRQPTVLQLVSNGVERDIHRLLEGVQLLQADCLECGHLS